jgi:hypothetical protein
MYVSSAICRSTFWRYLIIRQLLVERFGFQQLSFRRNNVVPQLIGLGALVRTKYILANFVKRIGVLEIRR